MSEKRKIVLVGTGFVGMSMAYSFLSTGGIDELVLLDVAKEKAVGEAMDLQHGLPYARGKMEIYAGDYADCRDASIVVITAGAAQKPEETRLDLTAKNAKIMKSVVESIMASGFDGILIIASNPVDGMYPAPTCMPISWESMAIPALFRGHMPMSEANHCWSCWMKKESRCPTCMTSILMCSRRHMKLSIARRRLSMVSGFP